MCSPALALTPTPTVTPCTTLGPPELSAELDVQPEHPVVGEQVVLTFHAFGSGGLPQYTLVGGDPVLQGNPAPVRDSMFGNPVPFELTAAQAGTAVVALEVNFETASGCVDHPIFQFVTLTSDPFEIEVGESGPTPTESPTPTPTSNRPVPVAVPSASPNPALGGELVTLTSSASHGAINQRYWNQVAGPPVVLEGCQPTGTDQCEGESVQFTAPSVAADTTLVFRLVLTSYGSTPGDSQNIAVTVLPAGPAPHPDDDSCSIGPPARAHPAALLLALPAAIGLSRRKRDRRRLR